MSLDGTWADNLIIQAVAHSLNLSIRIVESHKLFAPLTHIEPVVSHQVPSPMNLRLTAAMLNLRNGANKMLFYPDPLDHFYYFLSDRSKVATIAQSTFL